MRVSHQEQIKIFIKRVFKSAKNIDFEAYKSINMDTSSEMLYAVMGLFHQVLPQSETIFRLKLKFHSTSKSSPSKIKKMAPPQIMKLVSHDDNDANSDDDSFLDDNEDISSCGVSPRMTSLQDSQTAHSSSEQQAREQQAELDKLEEESKSTTLPKNY
jgi:hypothetical protein